MAKKSNRGLIYGAVAVLGVAGFLMTEPPKPTSDKDSEDAGPRRSSSRKEKETVFTKEDEQARFARLEGGAKNAFRPLITESDGRSSRLGVLANQIPPDYVNGESGWFYTGTAIVDGVPMALIEDTAKGQGSYLKVGESVLNATVVQISPSAITVAGPNGATKTLRLIENRPINDDVNAVASSRSAPFDPAAGNASLRGSISPTGSGRTTQVMPGGMPSAQAAPGAPGPNVVTESSSTSGQIGPDLEEIVGTDQRTR